MFAKILIANRGEIAVRIIRACKEMGIATVAVYSDADREALHVQLADESICIGAASSSASYLNEERIISAALASGAVAIHPGYGFLSENEHFAALCEANGLVFIGASLKMMQLLSDKAQTKRRMSALGLPVIPGSAALESLEEALAAAAEIGYPLMLKARSGGGGRGIRKINTAEELKQVYATAQAESFAAFGDTTLYLEKCIYPARHIEFQIIADEYGKVLCLGERDCSLQRNHQKFIEEAPSPAVTEAQREALKADICKAVKALGYVGLGTLEFLLDEKGRFWFMEMNLRLQVEHGLTELLYGIDLVQWQIRLACGIPLKLTPEDLRPRGAALECRICARTSGRVKTLHVPGGPFVRFDTALLQNGEITPFYDALLGKLVVWAEGREEVVRKMRVALCELVIEGVETNIEEELDLIGEQDFICGSYDLRFMEGR